MGDDGLIRSYRCPAGKWTIGYGATRGVRSGMRITEGEAEERLLADLNEHAEALHRYVEVPLSQNQYDALTSFVFNVGAANFKSSTLLKRLNSGQYHDIPNQLMRWNKAKTMAGAGLAGAATALSEITPQIEALVPYSESMKSIFLLCAIGGIALVAYSRWKDSKEGTR